MRRKGRAPAWLLAVCLAVALLPVARADWTGNFNQKDNNAVTTAALPTDSTAVKQAWRLKVGESTIAIRGDYLYTYNATSTSGAMNGGTLYKINKNTGSIEKQVTATGFSGYQYSYAIFGGDTLYISCADCVMAFDPDTLEQKWLAQRTTNKDYVPVQYVNGFVVSQGLVLNGSTGAKVRELEGVYNYSSGAVQGGYFYIASGDGKLYAFDTTNWEKKYELKFTDNEGNQPGVALMGTRLFWGGNDGKLYSVQFSLSDGGFVSNTLISKDCNISGVCVPVIAGGKVYYAGAKKDSTEGAIAVLDMKTLEIEATYSVDSKIQSTPILREVKSGGNTVASVRSQTVASGNYVYFQTYNKPSKIYVLKDLENGTSSLETLVTLEPQEYAFEQIACDSDGSLYVSNDSFFLMKYTDRADAVVVRRGDVNGDGNVDSKDVTQLKRYLAQWSDVTIRAANADVNGDNTVDGKDVTYLKRALAGWEGYTLN